MAAAIACMSVAGRLSYCGAKWSMNQSGRNSMKVASSSTPTSAQVQRVRNHRMVAAANVSDAKVAPATTSASSHP
ncbi:hypothetical protein D3C73_956880 [compost metagenome]